MEYLHLGLNGLQQFVASPINDAESKVKYKTYRTQLTDICRIFAVIYIYKNACVYCLPSSFSEYVHIYIISYIIYNLPEPSKNCFVKEF